MEWRKCATPFFIPSELFRRCIGINDLMINEEIRDREVRVVDQNGEQLGVMSARQALEMALGRGGDQAAVKQSEEYKFFGGVSKGVEKRDKVRTRVIAGTLITHIKNSSNVGNNLVYLSHTTDTE